MKIVFLAVVAIACAHAQGRSQAEWMTSGADMQRSYSIPTDPKISVEALSQPGFQFLWKTKLSDDPLGPAMLMERYIGYRGFRSLAFFSTGVSSFAAIDSDLNRVEWKQNLSVPAAPKASTCGPLSAVTRTTFPPFPSPITPGRSAFAHSDVGAEGAGAVTIPAALRAATAVLPPRGPEQKPKPALIYSLAADGKLHSLFIGNGEEFETSIDFLPPIAAPQGFVVVNNAFAYASTNSCNGIESGVWALDITTKQVTHWKPEHGDVAGSGGPALAPDGTMYAATTAGEIIALAPRTLDEKERYQPGGEFTTSPVIFPYRLRNLMAAAMSGGTIHLLDLSSLAAPVTKSTPDPARIARTEMTTWQGANGTRWLLATNGSAIVTWKLADHDGAISIEPGWMVRDMKPAGQPIVINGVVFVLSTTLRAFDGDTGRELWNSGTTLPASVRHGNLSGGAGQLYLSTDDGTVYAFGFPMEH
jgi:hypothetical protein